PSRTPKRRSRIRGPTDRGAHARNERGFARLDRGAAAGPDGRGAGGPEGELEGPAVPPPRLVRRRERLPARAGGLRRRRLAEADAAAGVVRRAARPARDGDARL